MSIPVKAENLSKWYGQVAGILNVDLQITGGVVGLLGPNGAGKTTFMRLLTGQLRPSAGEVSLFGAPVWNNLAVMARIGYSPEHDGTWDELTGREFVRLCCRMSGMNAQQGDKAADEAIAKVTMEQAADRRIRTYSKGMRQRIKLAQAVAHDPDLIILDEPLTGCDPVVRAHIMELVRELGRQGKTILVSSHILHEVEAVTHQIVLLYKGQVLATGDIHGLRDLIDEHPHRIEIACREPRTLAVAMTAQESVRSVTVGEQSLTLETDKPDACYTELMQTVVDQSLQVDAITSPDDNLEAVFRYLTNRSATGV
ncbi:MAG: ABC transporter ATP-binding protein [Deltaproteobacteria bacterium]|nr:ABC transporter ATP-binding protein [Deltaproteobacteria bacterium]